MKLNGKGALTTQADFLQQHQRDLRGPCLLSAEPLTECVKLRRDDKPVEPGIGTPQGVKAQKARNFDWDPIRGLHLGQRLDRTTKAVDMTAFGIGASIPSLRSRGRPDMGTLALARDAHCALATVHQ